MADQSKENLYRLLTANPRRIYVIANAGLNHGGNKERALALVRAAKWVGADAVKFQMLPAQKADIFRALYKEAKRMDIDLLSTPHDEESADFFDELGVSAYKIAAGDIMHRALIEHVARKGKPVLLSTPMSAPEEIEPAIDWMHAQSNDQIVLLHCALSYPAGANELNLDWVQFLRDRFGVPVGFSDQSIGALGSIVAASLGAQVIEKNFMIETRSETPDHAVSMDAKTLKAHIEVLRTVGVILGPLALESGHEVRSLY